MSNRTVLAAVEPDSTQLSAWRPPSPNPSLKGRGEADQEHDAQSGFTLLEILVVIVILGLLIGLVAPAALRQLGGARVSIAKQSIERLGGVLDIYKLDTGSYPTTEQGLAALVTKPSDVGTWNGPYVKGEQLGMDAWNHPYLYANPSTRPAHEYDLCSRGPNAQAGDSAQDGMICNP